MQPIVSRLKVKKCWYYLLHAGVIRFFCKKEMPKNPKIDENS